MNENVSSEEPKSFLADEERFKSLINESVQSAYGYLDGSNDFSAEVQRRLEKAQSFEELKADLFGIIKEREEFSLKTQEWFP